VKLQREEERAWEGGGGEAKGKGKGVPSCEDECMRKEVCLGDEVRVKDAVHHTTPVERARKVQNI
jgi:hypothetical protein